MNTIYIFSVFLHIVFAAFWIGGMLFLPLVLLPPIKNHPDRIKLLYKTGIKFRFYGWIALIMLMISGLANVYYKGYNLDYSFFMESDYGQLLSIKITLFVLMLLIGGIHDFYLGKKTLSQLSEGKDSSIKLLARWTGRINLILALSIAFIGVALSRGWF